MFSVLLFGLFSLRGSQPKGFPTSCLRSSSWETQCMASASCWRTPTTTWARGATSCTTCPGWWAAWAHWCSTSSYPFPPLGRRPGLSPTYMLHAELVQTAPCDAAGERGCDGGGSTYRKVLSPKSSDRSHGCAQDVGNLPFVISQRASSDTSQVRCWNLPLKPLLCPFSKTSKVQQSFSFSRKTFSSEAVNTGLIDVPLSKVYVGNV